MPLTVGTAGHIDHGKTWLVRALTGVDTDRLPEEQARGISIELGYAPLELGDGRWLSLVDVPGHERFVRTMVAGATGIDLFLLVIDAAEGARPQTHEHLAILRLLGVEHGVVALTKADAVDDETLELARLEAEELVPGTEVVATSARTGIGLDELRAALARAADRLSGSEPLSRTLSTARLYLDRVFTLRGIGTVATGTLWSGSVGGGDNLRAEPAGLDVRIRSVQVHGHDVERAEAGQRVAVSLPGVERTRLHRGDALVEPDAYPLSYRLDVTLEELASIPDGARLHVHHGTARIPARVVRVGAHHAQLRLAAPVVAARGDRFVLRAETTLGGGTVLDPAPPRARDATRLDRLERRELAATIHAPVTRRSLRHLLDGADEQLEGVVRAGDWLFAQAWLDELRADLAGRLAAADPLDPGVPPPTAPWAAAVEPLLGLERRGAKLYAPGATAALGARAEAAALLEAELAAARFDPVRVDDRTLAAYLEREGRLVRVGDGLALSTSAYDEALRALVSECERAGRITLARLRDLLGTGRRSAQLLLERFDADGVTRRIGDERVLRRRARL
jgi:selenocysteine-specific elongation factor